MRFRLLVIVAMLAACGPRLPPPNSADARYDGQQRAVQVRVSSLQPPTAWLWSRLSHPLSGRSIALVSRPHVLYNPPPSIGIGIGGFGFSGCCSAFGSGLGVGVPVGQPTPAEISDQFVASALIPSPADYATTGADTTWRSRRVGRLWMSQPLILLAELARESDGGESDCVARG